MGKKKIKTRRKRLLIIMLAVFLFLLLGFGIVFGLTANEMKKIFSRGEYPDHSLSAYYWYEDYSTDYPREQVQFQSGEVTLTGFIYGMENTDKLLVFAHGIGAGHENYLNTLLWFVDQGWRVFAYDATGSGYSEGSGTRGLSQSALDLDSALTFAEQDARLKNLPKVLLGHSWGAYAAAAVLNFDHDVKASVSIAGYADPVEMLSERAEDMMGHTAAVCVHPFMWLYHKAIFGKYAGLDAVDGINHANIPVLLVHGVDDDTVSFARSSIIAHQSEITNPLLETCVIRGAYAGHSNIFNSDESNRYQDTIKKNAGIDRYPNGKLPDDVKREMVANANPETVNQVNEDLMQTIDMFYLRALESAAN